MSSTVVNFPGRFKPRLPDDAVPKGKDRHVEVFPFKGKWALINTDDGGGSFATGLTKQQAMADAIDLVMNYFGTLTVTNHNPDEANFPEDGS